MTRRPRNEIIADLEQKAARLRADSERRLAVASDPFCSMLWDAEKALREVASCSGAEGQAAYGPLADRLALDRVTRWKELKEKEASRGS